MTRFSALFFTGLFLVSLSFFSSCGKVGDITGLSDEEVAELIEAAVAQANGGLAEELESISAELEELTLDDLCENLYVDTLSFEKQATNRTAARETVWTFDLICGVLDLPQSADLTYWAEGSYATPRMDSDDEASFDGTVDGLQPTASSTIWNGAYQRLATQDLSFKNQNSISSDLLLTLVNITVVKGSQEISSGTATFTYDITENGTSSSFIGSLIFNGNGTATLDLNGSVHTIYL